MPKTILVAVYGSLRVGHGNYYNYLRDQDYLGTERVYGFDLHGYDNPYPYAVPGGGTIVVDVFSIIPPVLISLDLLEGYPHHYKRKKIDSTFGKAWIYYDDSGYPLKFRKVNHGDWSRHMLDVQEGRVVQQRKTLGWTNRSYSIKGWKDGKEDKNQT